jgi:hypothetical protein
MIRTCRLNVFYSLHQGSCDDSKPIGTLNGLKPLNQHSKSPTSFKSHFILLRVICSYVCSFVRPCDWFAESAPVTFSFINRKWVIIRTENSRTSHYSSQYLIALMRFLFHIPLVPRLRICWALPPRRLRPKWHKNWSELNFTFALLCSQYTKCMKWTHNGI